MVQVHVRDHGDPTVPGVGGVESAAKSDFDQGDIELLLREPPEDDRGQQLELGRGAEPWRQAVHGRQGLANEPGEVLRRHGSAVHHEPLPVGHEMRLGRLSHAQAGGPQRRAGEREDASLAVRPGDEGAAEPELRVAEFAQERAYSPKAQVDPEPTALGDRDERLIVGERFRDDGHSRDNSSS